MTVGKLAGLGVTWDDGVPVGFQVGKAAALLDWEHKREAAGFQKLCARLYARNWARRQRQLHPELVQERQRQWRERHREHVRQIERERMRKKYLERRPTCICDQCGKRWKPAPSFARQDGVRERKARFCSLRCANRWHGARRQRSKGIRQMDISRIVRRILGANPWLTPKEVAAKGNLKPGSVATLLCVWHQQGLMERRRDSRAYRYALKGARDASL